MFFRSLFRGSAANPLPPKVSDDSRVYAIGDIHGCAGLLDKLHRMILKDMECHDDKRNVVIYLGDYVDRGPDSRAVIDMLIEDCLPGFETIFLKGNHEDSLLRFLDDPEIGPAWLAYGGDATLYSYGVRPPDWSKPGELQRAQKEFVHTLPAAHKAFFAAMALFHVEGDYAFVHAGFRESVSMERQSPADMLWIRDEFLDSRSDFGKMVVHGHSIQETPVVRRNRIGIDTGAFATGVLTCLVLEKDEQRFLST
jgi:serine/threonine protein phosphatase 1